MYGPCVVELKADGSLSSADLVGLRGLRLILCLHPVIKAPHKGGISKAIHALTPTEVENGPRTMPNETDNH